MSNPNLFFSTPVWVSTINNYKETNEKIYHYIKNLHSADNEGIVKSNVKGWHSNDFNMKDKDVIDFINLISPNINKVLSDMNWDISKQKVEISNMWAIINTGGSANLRHQHGNSTISGAYYVRAPKECGDIVFYDPRPAPVYSYPNAINPNLLNAQINGISPNEGGLVMFPSYLDHSVNENLSKEERIVISFNVTIQPRSN